MTKEDGGPAFPKPNFANHWGMTLRDWFAGQALAGQLANPTFTADSIILAQWAYTYADAMLAEREETDE